ncbi:MAG: hypothetical protein AAF696_11880 [Bacteroidota bacterium]
METLIPILTWASLISGGFLIFLMLFSLVGGLDFDMDLDMGSTDVDTDAGGIGLMKGGLTFISVSSWIVKLMLVGEQHPVLAIAVGTLSGIIAFSTLNYIFRFLIRQEENVNWKMKDALEQKGEVYLKIPTEGEGIIRVLINGANRELKARSVEEEEIKTGEQILVTKIEGEYALVKKVNHFNTKIINQ